MNDERKDKVIRDALAASLVLHALVSPISKSAMYFPLFASTVFALLIWNNRKRIPFLRELRPLFVLWSLTVVWQYTTLLVNGNRFSLSPVTRALNFLPVFVLAGLPLKGGWKERVAIVSVFSLFSMTAMIIIAGVYQGATGVVFPFSYQPFSEGRLLGFFSHHIPAGGFFSILVISSASLLLFWKASARTKIFLGILLILLLLGALLTLSRTYFISLCITLPLLFFKKDLKVAAIGSALMAVFITAAIVFLPPVKNKVASIADLQKNPSNVERLYLWRVARDMIAHSPITGVGFRQWGEKVPEYSARYSPSWKFSPASFHHAHNTYLQVAAETGLVGLALFLGFWLNLTALAFRLSARYPAGSFVRALNLGTAFSIINLLIGGLFEDNFGTLLIALILSYVVSLSFFAANGKKA